MRLLAIAAILLSLAGTAAGATPEPWPLLLGPRQAFAPDVSDTVERVWSEPTLHRTLTGNPVRGPLAV